MAYVGFPPIYAGEITLVAFAPLVLRKDALSRFIRNPISILVCAYVFLPMLYFTFHQPTAKAAITDFGLFSVVAHYAIFFYYGYAAVHTVLEQRAFLRLMYFAILLSLAHSAARWLVPLRELPLTVNEIPLLGHFDLSGIYRMCGLAYVAIFYPHLGKLKSLALLGLFATYLFCPPSRGFVVVLVVLTGILLWYWRILPLASRRHAVTAVCVAVLVMALGYVIAPSSGMSPHLDAQVDVVVATVSDSPNLPGKAGSKAHRIAMWSEIIGRTLRDAPLFGAGFAEDLTDAVFRNPHSSFVTIFGRMGLVGLSISILIYFGVATHVSRALTWGRSIELRRYLLFYLCFWASFVNVALVQGTPLESPYSALVCNFVLGAAWRCAELARVPVLAASGLDP